jgi:hypothetical protein
MFMNFAKSAAETATSYILSDAVKNAPAAVAENIKSTARFVWNLSTNLADVNGDGKVDKEDLDAALAKIGSSWKALDPDLKTALLAGVAAGVGTELMDDYWAFRQALKFLPGNVAYAPAVIFFGVTIYTYANIKISKAATPTPTAQ